MESLKEELIEQERIEKFNRHSEAFDISGDDWISGYKGELARWFLGMGKSIDLRNWDPSTRQYGRLMMMRSRSDFEASAVPHGIALIATEANDYKWSMPAALKPIADQIEEAKEILDYEFDWDDDGGLPTDKETFGKATSFVVEYCLWIFRHYGSALSTPYIDIMKDGAVSIHWETAKGQFLIIFDKKESPGEEEKDLGYFYAEKKPDGIPFKGAVSTDGPVEEFLAVWMKENLL